MEQQLLSQLGWSDWFDERFSPYRAEGLEPGRVSADYGSSMAVTTATGIAAAQASGRLRHEAGPAARPVIGDWVALRREAGGLSIVHAVLERRTAFVRKVAGAVTEPQVMAANIDRVFVVSPMSAEPNLAGLERFLTIAWESGGIPVLLLTKADLAGDVEASLAKVETIAAGVTVLVTSSVTGEGVELVRAELRQGMTAVLVGPSGAGKSTLINRLTGRDELATRAIRKDGKGRHTTTRRELVLLPGGGVIIDTPGLRELQLWHGEAGLDRTFDDVAELAAHCRFNDCRHLDEPGCAVCEALANGTLPAARMISYRKLEREIQAMRVREDHRLQATQRQRWKTIEKSMRQHPKK